MTPITVRCPFPEFISGFSAAERTRDTESEMMDMLFEHGMFTTEDPLQIEILTKYHTGCTITTPGKYKGKILRPANHILFKITDQDPKRVGEEMILERGGSIPAPVTVAVNKIPRMMVNAVDIMVLVDVLLKERDIVVTMPVEKSEVIAILERENLISD